MYFTAPLARACHVTVRVGEESVTVGVTLTFITLLGGGGEVGEGKVVTDRVAVEGSDVVFVDVIDGGSVEDCVGEIVGPAHRRNYWLNLENIQTVFQ